ncbi:hypothetical protein EBV26_19200 [bacterium]|nr:hypothetical protein [bacterium]
MPNYLLGKVYKIVGNGKVYVGSTTLPLLSQRLSKHKEVYRAWKNDKYHYVTSFDCIDDPNCYIELIEACPCNTIDELHKCEGKWIREIECVNKVIPSGNPKEHYNNYHREYYKTNKEKMKEYYKTNKEKIKEYQKSKNKEYFEANKEKIKEYQKEYQKRYYQKNKISGNIGEVVSPLPE